MPRWHGQPQKTRYAFTVSGSAAVFGGAANNVPVWQNVPHITFFVGITSTFPISGTYQSNNYVTDADFDTIVITKNNIFVQGVSWDGGKFTSNGTGSQTTVTGHILTADDGHNSNVASSAFQIALIPGLISWTSVPSITFVEGSTSSYSFGQNVLNYNAATDEFRVTPGYSLPSWLSLTPGPGTGSGNLTPNGTQLDADDVSASPGIKIDVRRSGGAWVSSGAFGVTVTEAGPFTFQEYWVATWPAGEAGATPGTPMNFGKHYAWAGPHSDGCFYNLGGDGRVQGQAESGGAPFCRLNLSTQTLDFHHPYYGVSGQPFPKGADAFFFMLRANGNFVGIPGYQWAGTDPLSQGTEITYNTAPVGHKRYDYVPNPGGYGTWSYSAAAAALPLGAMGENNSTMAYDPSRDKVYNRSDGLATYDFATNTYSYVGVSAGVPVHYWQQNNRHIYVSETDEVFFLCLSDGGFGKDESKAQQLAIGAVKVTPGGSFGQTRYVSRHQLPIPYSAACMNGMYSCWVIVPSRRKIYVFMPEWGDTLDYANSLPYVPYDPDNKIGGIFELSFNAGYTSATMQKFAYPENMRAYARAGFNDYWFNNVYYDPYKDRIWATHVDEGIICEWGWTESLPSWLSDKALNSWVDVPNSKILNTNNSVANYPPWQSFIDAGLQSGGILRNNDGAGGTVSTSVQAGPQIWGFSGFWWNESVGRLGIACSGGGIAWNANGIDDIGVFDESPAWTQKVAPRNVSQTNPLSVTPAQPFMLDGSPNCAHTYFSHQFDNSRQKLMVVAPKNFWAADNNGTHAIHRWNYGASDWSAAGTEPSVPSDGDFSATKPGYDNGPTVIDPTNGDLYVMWAHSAMRKRDGSTLVWSVVPNWSACPASLNVVNLCKGVVCFWRRTNGQYGIFGVSGDGAGNYKWWCFEFSNGGVWHELTSLTGLSTIAAAPTWLPESGALVFDSIDDEFVYWNNYDATLYRLQCNFTNSLAATALSIATTYTNAPDQDVGASSQSVVGLRLILSRGCLILGVSPHNPLKIIRRH